MAVTRRAAGEPAAGASEPKSGASAAVAAPRLAGWLTVGETDDYDVPAPAPLTHVALLAVTLAPLLLPVPPNVAIVLTPTLAILAGSYRSVKEAPPTETMTQKDAMRFPLVGRRARTPGRPLHARPPTLAASSNARTGCVPAHRVRTDTASGALSRTAPLRRVHEAPRRARAAHDARTPTLGPRPVQLTPLPVLCVACHVRSCFLLGLFLLFKYLPKDLVNAVLTGYFVLLVRPPAGRAARGARCAQVRAEARTWRAQGVLALATTGAPFAADRMPRAWARRTVRAAAACPRPGRRLTRLGLSRSCRSAP